MKTKAIIVMTALLMLFGVSANAQSGTTPIKGDVNEDGKVDVADIVAVINIMKNGGGESPKEGYYYWYIGDSNQYSIGNIQTASNVAGWHEIGTSTSGFNIEFNNDNRILFDEIIGWYVIIPESLHIYAADGNTNVESRYFDSVTSYIPGYKAFQTKDDSIVVRGIIIKK